MNVAVVTIQLNIYVNNTILFLLKYLFNFQLIHQSFYDEMLTSKSQPYLICGAVGLEFYQPNVFVHLIALHVYKLCSWY